MFIYKILVLRTSFLIKNPKLHIPINIGLCTLSFFVTLPATLAIFPQMSEVSYHLSFQLFAVKIF